MGKFERVKTKLNDITIIRPTVFKDDRGFFLETYNREEFAEVGITDEFVQDNVSHSAKGVVRGLHYQSKNAQGKLVRVLRGKIFDVVVDIRNGSPTYGHHLGIELDAQDAGMLFVPVGFAHGFMALKDATEVMYKVTDFYSPQYDAGIRWDDPDLRIPWPMKAQEISRPVVSPKDAVLPFLRDIISPFNYAG
ncbi:dTDP-4-dehydrorhamnose 3,5-epimerase [Methanoregula boonei 6A8]|uniref:dTDP-4-dehydrorhamnose 3,5-epimerase n=1 Tax=Methanoregula boonei (strain DSM 21154 / JCM 14090 / 6A8) TaxID=456442 RepID=A7I957_METB6|nr:dTDP-4-dehydrorhamnose 3,5-epimerase [Methanoregula boonei]ABS56268.1 dTDP-4-dehydrorhamnose 3,5-epimerase [Methanoregula boonei 6A8]